MFFDAALCARSIGSFRRRAPHVARVQRFRVKEETAWCFAALTKTEADRIDWPPTSLPGETFPSGKVNDNYSVACGAACDRKTS